MVTWHPLSHEMQQAISSTKLKTLKLHSTVRQTIDITLPEDIMELHLSNWLTNLVNYSIPFEQLKNLHNLQKLSLGMTYCYLSECQYT